MINLHNQNRQNWNEVTPVHMRSPFYDVDGFLAGKSMLDEIELTGVGDVRGKSLLHLQCHFGMDTLSFARLGARVCGVDFSDVAIQAAHDLANKAGLSDVSRFICCDVLELDRYLDEQFDIVFTSYGVITWLSDLQKWAQNIARCLKPGGKFFIAEIHPLSMIFKDATETFELGYNYFHDPVGVVFPPNPDYAEPSFTASQPEHYWAWPLMDIFSVLNAAGLEIHDFREYPFTVYEQFPQMTKGSDGFWHVPDHQTNVPLLFSLSAQHRDRRIY
jgi:2-polyprenyl-3-methyl-5-hydroxy-6-metoxy-1,4-benzoquinol methylase